VTRVRNRIEVLAVLMSLLATARVCCVDAARAQSFDVTSVKPSSLEGTTSGGISCSGGPGTDAPRVWRCSNMPLALVISRAFRFRAFQFSPHAACCRDRFNFDVRLPDSATRDQFDRMLQSLLRERFKLEFHYESKEMSVYELTAGSKGPKLKEASRTGPGPSEGRWWEPPRESGVDREGYPVFPTGVSGLAESTSHLHWIAFNISMQEVADALSDQLRRPVVDSTGLAGRYDIDLKWVFNMPLSDREMAEIEELAGSPPDGASGPSLFRAVQDQLGLKLISKKGLAQVVVIDHVEKVPTPN